MVELRAVIHIGSMKTGTTAFAAACTHAERSGTMPRGLLYPLGDLWFGDDRSVVKHPQSNAPTRTELARRNAGDPAGSGIGDFDRAIARSSTAARTRAVEGSATVLLVAEGLSHQMRPNGLTQVLSQHFDAIDYVLVARRQPRAVGSIMAHALKDVGQPKRWRLDAAAFLAKPVQARRFDYAGIVDRWRHEGATLHVMPFNESAPGSTTMIDAIFDRVGLPRLQIGAAGPARSSHPSFSADGLQELARIKRRHRALGWLPGADERYQASFRAAWKRHHRAVRAGTAQPWRLSAADERRVATAYAASNRRLFEQLGAQAFTPMWRDWFGAVGVDVGAATSPESHR